MEKMSPDATGVHDPNTSDVHQDGGVGGVQRLNRRFIIMAALGAVVVFAIILTVSVQSRTAARPDVEEEQEAEHANADAQAHVDGLMKRSERKLGLEESLKAEEAEAKKQAEVQAIEEALAEAEKLEEETQKKDDPWEKARAQARLRNAQSYFQEAHAARKSAVFAQVGRPQSPKSEDDTSTPSEERRDLDTRMSKFAALQAGSASAAPATPPSTKEEFFNRRDTHATRSYASMVSPISEYELQSGTILPLVLETAIDSDLPGLVKARIASPVYDTVTGRHLLIPSGSVVVGEYNASQNYGQQRVQVAWTRLLLPNGRSLSLGNLPGVSLDGSSGASDQVDEHWDRIIAGALFSSTLAGAAAAAGGDRNAYNVRPEQEALSGAASQIVKSGQDVTARNLDIEPTLRIRAGMRISAFVREDLVLEPYRRSQ